MGPAVARQLTQTQQEKYKFYSYLTIKIQYSPSLSSVYSDTTALRYMNGTTFPPLIEGSSNLAGLIPKAQENLNWGCHEHPSTVDK